MKKKNTNTIFLLQDIGFLGFLLCIVAVIILVTAAPTDQKIECLILFLALCVPIMLCIYKFPILAYTMAGLQILIYTIFKLYRWSAWNDSLSYVEYFWIIIPFLTVSCLQMYMKGVSRLEAENKILKEQMEDLVLIDPLTDLYNLRSLYNDLTRQMSLSRRNNTKIGIMVIKLKYAAELDRILSTNQFNSLRQTMAIIIEDNIRLEDKLYSVDSTGTIVIFMHCDLSGSEVVANKLKNALYEKDAFKDEAGSVIKVDVKIGFVQYEKDKIANAFDFFQKANSEVQYDV